MRKLLSILLTLALIIGIFPPITNLGACYSDNAWSSMVYATNVGPLNAEEQTINATIPITVTGLSVFFASKNSSDLQK